jgi:hypothetical protein
MNFADIKILMEETASAASGAPRTGSRDVEPEFVRRLSSRYGPER